MISIDIGKWRLNELKEVIKLINKRTPLPSENVLLVYIGNVLIFKKEIN